MTTSDAAAESLERPSRPDFEGLGNDLRVVDLFAGCGGLTLGVAQGAMALGRGLDIRLAVEIDEVAAEVYRQNFAVADTVRVADVTSLLSPILSSRLTETELSLKSAVGDVDVLVGGPPCQGHSNLNNHTRRNDPKNALYAVMARAASVFRPRTVIIENVPAVLNDNYQGLNAVQVVSDHLSSLGYVVGEAIISLDRLGVAQKRRRHVLVASSNKHLDVQSALDILKRREPATQPNLRWAIGDLLDQDDSPFDRAPRASEENRARMKYLLEANEFDLPNSLRPPCHQGSHSYKSMYGRLSWEKPAQTITSGFGSIGQGRYMHPSRPRALTPHEAARIQGFPDYFDFSGVRTRGALATMIGNAVPPQLARHLLLAIHASDPVSPQADQVSRSRTAVLLAGTQP